MSELPDPKTLSDRDRFALCVAAGVEIETTWTKDFRLVMRPKNPISIYVHDGRYVVTERKP